MKCPVMGIWNTVLCLVHGHPKQTYEIVYIQYTNFFSSGVQTFGAAQCCRCKKILGRV